MRHLVALLVLIAFGSQAQAGGDKTKQPVKRARTGAVSGTAFWVGPFPDGVPLRDGEAHERDWVGADGVDHVALEDVVITATPLSRNGRAAPGDADTWPIDETVECYSSRACLPRVVFSQGPTLQVANYRSTPLAWSLTRDGRSRLELDVAAKQPEQAVDVHALAPGVYEIEERATHAHLGWLYRASPKAAVAGATNGNCRYSLGLKPGRYRVVAWHPLLAPVEQIVTVRAGVITRFNPVFASAQVRRAAP